MRSMIAISFLVCSLLVCSPTNADVIHLGNGKKIDGRVVEYVDQHLRIELPDGKVIIRKINEQSWRQYADVPGARRRRVCPDPRF